MRARLAAHAVVALTASGHTWSACAASSRETASAPLSAASSAASAASYSPTGIGASAAITCGARRPPHCDRQTVPARHTCLHQVLIVHRFICCGTLELAHRQDQLLQESLMRRRLQHGWIYPSSEIFQSILRIFAGSNRNATAREDHLAAGVQAVAGGRHGGVRLLLKRCALHARPPRVQRRLDCGRHHGAALWC